MENCVFCKIIAHELPAKFAYEDSEVVAFNDRSPQGRVHLLIVPVVHVEGFLSLQDDQMLLLTKMAKVIQSLVKSEKLEKSYYTMFSGGKRQEVPHFHWHLIGD